MLGLLRDRCPGGCRAAAGAGRTSTPGPVRNSARTRAQEPEKGFHGRAGPGFFLHSPGPQAA